MKYIDVRGPWPVFFDGFVATELVGFPRSVSIWEAEVFVRTGLRPNYIRKDCV